ncbi:methyl-accepting chemotaxis protein [Frigoriglobus tundricola]|uniref:Methyl-accepting chemotaxis protein I (Serine chemoreceptor protein) n=1 Tax=Frigoriglobus tundricola TaxID=2774151 RepID=A0A6M5YYG0_9BACT|nr:methyl-accepting chemotaxis protein [Frigoriglobus tundricola]QJW98243.1 Methyl-accepting chemotaxis protein I (serine chemoreceptor protein) [Frigoriglobus tundricola]
MNWFHNRRIGTKLLLGFGTVCALMAAIGVFALDRLSRVNESTTDIATNWMPSIKFVQMVNIELFSFRRAELQYLLTSSEQEQANFITRMEATKVTLEKARQKYEPLIASEEERRMHEDFRALLAAYYAENQKIIALTRAKKMEEARQLGREESMRALNATAAKLQELVDLNERGGLDAEARASATYASTRWTMIGVVGAGIFLSLVIAVSISRLIARPLAKAVEALDKVAAADFSARLDVSSEDEVGRLAVAVNAASESLARALAETGAVMAAAASGDLTRRITSETRGEVRKMAEALNAALDKMGSAMREVRASSGAVAEASTQLAAASEEISSGAQEQASSLEECASSLEEMTSAVRQNADNAQQARQLAEGARDAAEKGGKVVTQAVTAMSGINQSSKRIADIITTIDEIAFQTNLLALNAAVEAARAGDQGRGFAVVAAEVRSLARAAASAKEIKGLIQDSLRKVEGGSELVNQSGQSLAEIVSAVKRAADIVTEIAAASKEQAAGVEQVSKAVAQMDQVTQANAAQTEELSGTAQGLTGQADQLRGLVARFKLDDGSADEPARPAAPAPRPAKPVARPAAKPSKPAKPARPVPSLDLVGASSNGHHATHGNEDGFVEM